jgi:hypothetical protein
MHICKTAFVLSMAVAIGGALWAGLAEWGVAGVYGVGAASVLVYHLGVYWIEDRPAGSGRRASARLTD